MNKNNVYEIGLLINPDLSQQEAESTVVKVNEILNNNSASVISQGEIVNIELAYQIITKISSKNVRFDEANFTWVKFESPTSSIDLIKKEIDKNKKEIFRYLIIKTVSDDNLTDKFNLNDDENQEENSISVEEKEDDKIEIKVDSVEDGNTLEGDDLTKIEGIGPKTAEALRSAGINTFSDLADSKVGELRDILAEGNLSKYDPKTWSKQSKLARDEKWDELKKLQDELDGGEVVK